MSNENIIRVHACQPPAPMSPPDWRTSMGQILVVLETESGRQGFGVGGGGRAAVHIIDTVLAPILIGKNPADESLWEKMYQATLPFGRKGVAIMAISGVDLALWDLKAKSQALPVARLLGSPGAAEIPTYITLLGSQLQPAIEAGFRAFKIHLKDLANPREPDAIVELVDTTRSQVGSEALLMLDAFMGWDLDFALSILPRLQPFDLAWVEEPLAPDELEEYAELSRESPIPIAGGEHEFTSRGFEDLINAGAHKILQPDICWCGGMTEMIKIYQMADQANLQVVPHRGAEVWGLHAIAGLDSDPLAESGRPWMDWVQPILHAPTIQLPDGPGFGALIEESAWAN